MRLHTFTFINMEKMNCSSNSIILKRNFEYFKKIYNRCTICYTFSDIVDLKVSEITEIELYINDQIYYEFKLTLDQSRSYWKISSYQISNIEKLIKMFELFCKNVPLKLKNITIYSCYIPVSFMKNRFFLMIFGLTLIRNISDIEICILKNLNKYKLLKKLDYFPVEICMEISNYFIYFLLINND
jgi:hypothetical protein